MYEQLEEVKERVGRVRSACSTATAIVGFDANGIQELVTASSRPIAMRGASQAIRDFDEFARNASGCIFAGGGRGLFLVPEHQAKPTADRMVSEFSRRTHGGVLATATVPLKSQGKLEEAQALHWLGARLLAAKDAAPPPAMDFATTRADQCDDCQVRRGTRPSERQGAGRALVCERCFEFARLGRQNLKMHQAHWSFDEMLGNDQSKSHPRRLVTISLDGNNLGSFFSSLETLEGLAVGSAVVARLFLEASEEALSKLDRGMRVVTGGDDVRVFVPVRGAIDFVEAFVAHIRLATNAPGSLEDVLGKAACDRFRKLGVGIGLLVTEPHYPAWKLTEMAHVLELLAKGTCVRHRARFAMGFAYLSSGAQFSEAELRENPNEWSVPLEGDAWSSTRKRAELLAKIGTSQRSLFFRPESTDKAEFANLLAYQVARDSQWKRWFEAVGVDWRDREKLGAAIPGPLIMNLSKMWA